LSSAAEKAGHSSWSLPPLPSRVGNYNSTPGSTRFFGHGGFQSPAGRFFLDWYFSALKDHGKRVMSAAHGALGSRVGLSGKVAGVHWWSRTPSHAAELTAGYYNTNFRDAYFEVAKALKAGGASAMDFTCLEMKNTDPPSRCMAAPAKLVRQAIHAARRVGLELIGENAMPRYDEDAYEAMLEYKGELSALTFLSLTPDLVSYKWLPGFSGFISRMHAAAARRLDSSINPVSWPSAGEELGRSGDHATFV